ncbi:hypothetical protein [Priestia flexa]|uniref:hypothetical protein n=1 Tax=Priestia flexa TaxID=86664 RepID=UPI001CFE607B|nr:hypothetical protein [Priestia flexa]
MGTLRGEMEKWNKLNHVLNEKDKRKTQQPPKRKKKETFSERELRELMGTNRSTYHRSRGAIRQK